MSQRSKNFKWGCGLLLLGAIFVVVVVVGGSVPFVVDIFRTVRVRHALQNRTDYPQIAAACLPIARAVTNGSQLVELKDPVVPALIRSLEPRYIAATSNRVTLEFHGGFDHYGYNVRRSEGDPDIWEIIYYTEDSQKLLATISEKPGGTIPASPPPKK